MHQEAAPGTGQEGARHLLERPGRQGGRGGAMQGSRQQCHAAAGVHVPECVVSCTRVVSSSYSDRAAEALEEKPTMLAAPDASRKRVPVAPHKDVFASYLGGC